VMVSKNGDIVAGKRELASYLDRMIGAAPALKKMRTRVQMESPPGRTVWVNSRGEPRG